MSEAPSHLSRLEEKLGVRFRDKSVLQQALVHRSFLNEHPEWALGSNERLEFLGDAFIGLVVAEALYRNYPHYTEGQLTELRISLVRGETLAAVGGRLGIGEHLYLGRGERAAGGQERASNLAAAVEALVGATLVDRGYRAARALVLRLLKSELLQQRRRGVVRDAKSMLQELVQRCGLPAPRYRTVGVTGTPEGPRFTVEVLVGEATLGSGVGRRKVDAERQAAIRALETLRAGAGSVDR
ncbi:MAG: ribonuclease III [Chloroflexi bacterium]|nr:ribonuclease III [Chloroflexota bacterium]